MHKKTLYKVEPEPQVQPIIIIAMIIMIILIIIIAINFCHTEANMLYNQALA